MAPMLGLDLTVAPDLHPGSPEDRLQGINLTNEWSTGRVLDTFDERLEKGWGGKISPIPHLRGNFAISPGSFFLRKGPFSVISPFVSGVLFPEETPGEGGNNVRPSYLLIPEISLDRIL